MSDSLRGDIAATNSVLYTVLASTGFRKLVLEEMTIDVIEVDDGRAYREAMSDLAAPVMALVRQLNEATRTDK